MRYLFLFLLPLFAAAAEPKLYWFIPDGMRADPEEFDVYRWAEEGELPNMRRMMQEGAYGFSIPDFPSHTPTNFATLMTGSHPVTHGVADGPMHSEGAPLVRPSVGGFSSVAKRVSPVWTLMERDHGKKVLLLSIPGSTPPELSKGVTIRGRWGGWGADNYSVVFESEDLLPIRKTAGRGFRLFFFGPQLTVFAKAKAVASGSREFLESELASQGVKIQARIYKSKGKTFDRVSFSFGKKAAFANLKQGEWSRWIPVEMEFKGVRYPSQIRLKAIKIWGSGSFRIRMLVNGLNKMIVQPAELAEPLVKTLGPMVDFADNWPHQLVYEPEDKATFLEEARMSWDWHRRSVAHLLETQKPDVFIHDIYTPNLMLESRWWYRDIDKTRPEYSAQKAKGAMKDILELYKGLDSILGEAMKKKEPGSFVVLSSDHGVCHLNRLVRLNNLFAQKGWLKYTNDPVTGETQVDWENTKVIYLKMAHIFISPTGLGGNWKRSSGPEYEQLRKEVADLLRGLADADGTKPLVNVVNNEDAATRYALPRDRVGDLVIEAKPPYFWYEELSDDGAVFVDSNTAGYKQSLDASKNKCMWTPFLVWGPGIKRNHRITRPISNADQLPTLLKAMGKNIPDYMEGKPLDEIFK